MAEIRQHFALGVSYTHKMLFSPSFCYENTAIEVPHFHGENLAEFHVWCAMAHVLAGFDAYVYDACQHARARMS